MKKKNIFILFVLITSCNIFNVHNVKNDFKWKNKKLKSSLPLKLDFNPVILKEFDSINSSFKYYFKDSARIQKIESTLKNKLSNRNFIIDKNETANLLRIDTLLFQDVSEMISVYSNNSYEFMGHYEKNDFKIEITGTLKLRGSKTNKKINSIYRFTEEPRESYVLKGTIAYQNGMINLDIIMNNVLNKFSYECYKKVKNNN